MSSDTSIPSRNLRDSSVMHRRDSLAEADDNASAQGNGKRSPERSSKTPRRQAPKLLRLPLTHLIDDGFRTTFDDIRQLADNIAEVGLLHPIPVRPDPGRAGFYRLISGRRRVAAHELLGCKKINSTVFFHLEDARLYLIAVAGENTFRKRLRPSEAVKIARALRPMADAEAKKRQHHQVSGASGNFTEAGQARDQVAALVGWSPPTLTKATRIFEAAERDPEIYGDLVKEMDRTGNISGVYIKLRKLQGLEPSKRTESKSLPFSVKRTDNGDLIVRVFADSPELISRFEEFIGSIAIRA